MQAHENNLLFCCKLKRSQIIVCNLKYYILMCFFCTLPLPSSDDPMDVDGGSGNASNDQDVSSQRSLLCLKFTKFEPSCLILLCGWIVLFPLWICNVQNGSIWGDSLTACAGKPCWSNVHWWCLANSQQRCSCCLHQRPSRVHPGGMVSFRVFFSEIPIHFASLDLVY